jgi:hemoglobin-like flavoprotein
MTTEISFESMSNVLVSWEHANQKYSCREDIGNMILMDLFELEPEILSIFGFKPHQHDIEANPMLRMGIMVHGLRIVAMIDGILNMLGPDSDVLHDILSEQYQRHRKFGVRKEHFAQMGPAVRGALSKLLDDKVYTVEVDRSWEEVFDVLTNSITRLA